MAQSFQLDPTYPPTSLKYNNPTAGQNPALLRVAGKTSSNISMEKNKKQLFENLENNNRKICNNAVRVKKSPRSKASSGSRSSQIQGRQPQRRSFSSQGSRSSYSSKQENALRNSQALLGNTDYQGPPYAYNTNSGASQGPKRDRYGNQYGNFFNFENSLYSNYKN